MNRFFDPTGFLLAARLASEQTQRTQAQWFRNWHDLMTTGFNGFSELLQMSSNAANQMTSQQHELLSMYANSADPSASHATKGELWRTVPRAPVSRLALITGGIGGLGTAMCQYLAGRGHTVIATYIPAERELAERWQAERRAEGLETGIAECDVTDWDACAELAARIKKQWGPVELLVNNAGITRDSTLAKMSPENWQAVLSTNLDSMFTVTKQFIEDMLAAGFGRIVNIASVNAHKGQFGQTNYATAKRGILGFTQALAEELANTGVTVNSVSPGYVGTQMVAAIPDEIKQAIIDKIPLERLAEPEEIALAVAFLLADEAEYITGEDLSVNGGLYLHVHNY